MHAYDLNAVLFLLKKMACYFSIVKKNVLCTSTCLSIVSLSISNNWIILGFIIILFHNAVEFSNLIHTSTVLVAET